MKLLLTEQCEHFLGEEVNVRLLSLGLHWIEEVNIQLCSLTAPVPEFEIFKHVDPVPSHGELAG